MEEITIAELVEARTHGAVLVDVRETEEYAEGHVPGAIHIPLAQLGHRIGEVPDEESIFVICRSGGRSLRGAEVLEASGRQAVSVAEGTLGWIAAGHPVVIGTDRG